MTLALTLSFVIAQVHIFQTPPRRVNPVSPPVAGKERLASSAWSRALGAGVQEGLQLSSQRHKPLNNYNKRAQSHYSTDRSMQVLLALLSSATKPSRCDYCLCGPARRRPLWVKGPCPAQAICARLLQRKSATRKSLHLDPEAATSPFLKSNYSKMNYKFC